MTRPVRSLAHRFWFRPNLGLTLHVMSLPGVPLFLTSSALVLSSVCTKLFPSAPNRVLVPSARRPRAA